MTEARLAHEVWDGIKGEDWVLTFDRVPYLVREPGFRHGALVPLLFHLILPFLPLARVFFANGFLALLDTRGKRFVAVDTLVARGGECRNREPAVAQYP